VLRTFPADAAAADPQGRAPQDEGAAPAWGSRLPGKSRRAPAPASRRPVAPAAPRPPRRHAPSPQRSGGSSTRPSPPARSTARCRCARRCCARCSRRTSSVRRGGGAGEGCPWVVRGAVWPLSPLKPQRSLAFQTHISSPPPPHPHLHPTPPGFHTYDYARHFISSCTRILGLEGTPEGVEDNGSVTRVAAFPIGARALGGRIREPQGGRVRRAVATPCAWPRCPACPRHARIHRPATDPLPLSPQASTPSASRRRWRPRRCR
jgi:hypothetical protein